MIHRRQVIGAAAGLATAPLCAPGLAQGAYPARPIRIVVPFAPGGVVDVTARLLTQRKGDRLGWQFVVENRPGGNGFIGVTAVTRAPADGYTLLCAHTGEFSVNPALFRDVPYDMERDLSPITMISDTPMMVIASMQSGFTTLADLLAAARRDPGGVSFSSPGTGSVNHLAGEWLAVAAGVRFLHAPFRGGAPAAAAVAAGTVAFSVVAVPAALPHIQGNRARVLGLTTARRTPLDPSWPTVQEQGVPDVDSSNWVGLFAPRGVPQPILDQVYAEVRTTLEQPEVRARYADLGAVVGGMPPAEFHDRIRRDLARYRHVITTGNITPE